MDIVTGRKPSCREEEISVLAGIDGDREIAVGYEEASFEREDVVSPSESEAEQDDEGVGVNMQERIRKRILTSRRAKLKQEEKSCCSLHCNS